MVQPSHSKMLNLSNLIKQYDGVRAVDDVSFKVEKGDIFGFLNMKKNFFIGNVKGHGLK